MINAALMKTKVHCEVTGVLPISHLAVFERRIILGKGIDHWTALVYPYPDTGNFALEVVNEDLDMSR